MVTAASSAVLERYVEEIRAIFGDRLRAIVVYGPHARGEPLPSRRTPINTLVLAASATADDLIRAAAHLARWRRRGLATPLLLSVEEFARSLDAFPLEYGEILARHRVVVGEQPFANLAVRSEDVRRALEVQVKSHLIHLREGFLEAAGRLSKVAALIERSAPAFVALMEAIARLQAEAPLSEDEAVDRVGVAAGLPAEVGARLLALARGDRLARRDAVAFFRRYLTAAEQLADYIDRWRR